MIVLTLAVAVLILFSLRGQYVLLTNADSGKLLYCLPAADGTRFSVSYTHSVNKSPVSEHYEIRNGTIYLIELQYKSFGAGMPTQPEDGQSLHFADGNMIISGFEREMTRLCYSIGRVANLTLHTGSAELPLNTLDTPGQPVLFTVSVLPRIAAFWNSNTL